MRIGRIAWLGLAPAAAILAIACQGRSPLPEGAELIPADTTFALSVDVPAVLNSEIYKRYQAQESAFGKNRLNFLRFAQATGLDPSKDIKRLLLMARAGESGLAEMSGVATGSFDGRKVHDFLVASGMPSRQVEGVDIFEFLVVEDRCRFCLAVIDASTAAFGDGETLEKIARVRKGSEAALASGDAGRLLRRVSRGAEAWGILRADDIKKRLTDVLSKVRADGGALAALGPIHEAAFSFDTTEPMRVLIEMTATSEDDAMKVADILKGAESLGRLALKEAKPELGKILSDLTVEADTGVVRVSVSIPSSDVATVIQVLGLDRLEQRLTPLRTPPPPAGSASPATSL